MSRLDLIDILRTLSTGNYNISSNKVKNSLDDIYEYTNDFPTETQLNERIYCLVNNINYNKLKCECGNIQYKFITAGKGYIRVHHECSLFKNLKYNDKPNLIKFNYDELIVKLSHTHLCELNKIPEEERNISTIDKIKAGYRLKKCNHCSKEIFSPYKYCSYKCSCSSKESNILRVAKCHDTKVKRYGHVAVGLSIEDIKNGITNSSKKPGWKEKVQKTCLDRYGVTNVYQKQENNIKRKESLKNNKDDIINKRKKTNLEKYGDENFNNKELKSKNRRNFYNGSKKDIDGILYFFKIKNLIKIGVVEAKNNLDVRIKTMIKSYGECELLFNIETNDVYGEERYFHKYYDDKNIILESGPGRTEFFKIDLVELESHIRSKYGFNSTN